MLEDKWLLKFVNNSIVFITPLSSSFHRITFSSDAPQTSTTRRLHQKPTFPLPLPPSRSQVLKELRFYPNMNNILIKMINPSFQKPLGAQYSVFILVLTGRDKIRISDPYTVPTTTRHMYISGEYICIAVISITGTRLISNSQCQSTGTADT